MHAESRGVATDLIVHGVPLGDQHTINASTLARATRCGREVLQRTVEFRKLVDGLVTHKRFTDKDDLVWIIDCDELCKGAHKGLR